MTADLVRPRPGDLERATKPHDFEPSGEHVCLAERCDVCGLVQRGTWIHPTAAGAKEAQSNG